MSRFFRLCVAVGLLVPAAAAAAADDGFRPIFDGKSLSGWRGDENFWSVRDGVIVAESTPDNPCRENTFLVWDQGEVDDFELKLEFRISGSDSANSGIQFRGVQREDGHVIGYQADIDRAGKWVGALYDEATGRGTLAARGQKTVVDEDGTKTTSSLDESAEELLKHINIDGWNEYSITARGAEITLKINGHVTARVTDNQPGEQDFKGLLALQLHSGPPMKIEFRNIRMKRFRLADARKKVVFVAGTKSHGYFSHEHNAGCLLLAEKLNTAARENGLPVLATVYTNGWPKDPTAFDNADTVVSYCDGGGRHYLNDRLEDFDYLVESRGIGLCCIHYAVEVPKGPSGEHFLKWIGGYFEPFWSVNPHWTATFENLPEHPVTRGVEPFEVRDEWYYHMRFPEDMDGVTPILTDLPPRESLNRKDGAHSGNPFVREAVLERKEPQHVAWAYERPGNKGRGFGFTGGHFHANWQNDNFRKVVLNAIVWTAGLEVPEGGVDSATPTQEELEANQDYPKPAQKKAAARKTVREVAAATTSSVKPVVSSPVVTTKTPGHAVEISADITGAEKLFLVITDGGNGFSCDWADWAEPRLVGPEGDLKLTELKWKAAATDFGSPQVNRNTQGQPLRIGGVSVEYGIGSHANSIIEYDLPAGHKYTRLLARGGLDNGGTDQGGCGGAASVQFHVFTKRPDRAFLARVTGNGGSRVAASHEADDALVQLDVHEDLQAQLFAAEPMMFNPTNIDIDHLGRVWVCEVINYRRFRNGDQPERTEGDRILILEDTDGDGAADKSTTFYQGRDVDSAHGICVLPTPSGKGTRALISCGDSVFYLIDDDGDLKADRKEVLFTGIDGTQHDHGIHAFVFGPDGKLYFNFGNAGKRIRDKDGNPIVDKAGNEVAANRNPYQEGMVFRCNMDGSEFETLGWNFRNNWEVAVDSFGSLWQSDNDDDGNRGVRINYVMEFGNYGYRDERTGAGWRDPRTGWHEEIPKRHWHLNDPGVMPNLLQTGAGSPTGICVYEGDLLPAALRGALIHTDAGPNICRAYVTETDGAGYTAEIVNILDGARQNNWFRPSDVCVAPDGSILVADWYDPGVGGHRMQDVEHGRLFRVAPAGEKYARYTVPEFDFSTPDGAVTALQSPNLAVRYMAFTALQEMGADAEPALKQLWESDDPRMRARALWVLGNLGLGDKKTLGYLMAAAKDKNPDIRITSIRLARQLRDEVELARFPEALKLTDPSPAVRREMLVGLRGLTLEDSAAVPEVWASLALQHDGEDRWYLEALGLAADGRWDLFLVSWLNRVGPDWKSKAGRDIVWRSRAEITPGLLARLIRDPETPEEELPRLMRAFDFQTSTQTQDALMKLAFAEDGGENAAFYQAEALNRLEGFDINSNPDYRKALDQVLEASEGTSQFVKLVEKFSVADRYDDLLALAQRHSQEQLGVEAARALLSRRQHGLLRKALTSGDRETVETTLDLLATAADGRSTGLLLQLMRDDEQPIAVRRGAVRTLGAIRPGAVELRKMAESGEYDPILKDAIAAALHTVQWRDIKEVAVKLFPLPPSKEGAPLPPITELMTRKGDVQRGKLVFHSSATCATCHVVGKLGKDVGPNLSEIGSKLSRQALLESILYPSAGISHNYESWSILTADGDVLTGIIVSETPDEIAIKDAKAIVRTVKVEDIEDRKKQEVSLMPADLQKVMSAQDLVDVVEYLTTLKKK
ncbi:PVC-type heme-binding CxxCH protein [Maioricimonas sp. JC845]|uniref:PVC-type heme-binding CxxCH protein n=1 Tax=Maioricimonas sp. JC845 TaxID=3232138 RepID=UPI003459945A